ncbi:hypothetical protein DH2020_008144 [Rehmannia glutinosa]|uniref:Ent-kaurene oxidase n=1 Tax=Rehmannia glutinosa TaxID=99300 RepID=A0ABR0U103_REHGL
MKMESILSVEEQSLLGSAITIVAVGVLTLWLTNRYVKKGYKKKTSGLPPPEIPGVPVIGNLLQLKEKKPHKTFTRWAEKYGPIYSIRTGSTKLVVLNSNDLAKEAMVTRFSSISTRKLSNAIKILTCDKNIVALTDYGEYHKTVKRHILTSTLGPNAQVLGSEVESVYVKELGTNLSREEIFEILVIDPMKAKTLSEQQMLMLLWEAIIESSDTTLVTTEWALYELAKDRERQDRLYREIQIVCGNEKITEKKLSELPYLSAVFHETLRKHSPAPIVPLRFVHEDTEIGGYHIPAGTEFMSHCESMGKSEDWKPERFLDGKYETMDLHKTMAFGAGKRLCAGALQAMLISCVAIGRLVQEFEWRLKEGEEENVDTLGLTTHKLHPLQVILKPRN